MANSKRLRLRLFLEGYEVPCLGATISASVNSPATANISIIPTDKGKKLLPRTHVALFIEDPFAKDDDWYLAFDGEYVAKTYSKTTDSRSITIGAVDVSNYFDNALSYFFNAKSPGVLGGAGANLNDVINYTQQDKILSKTYAKQTTPQSPENWFNSTVKKSIEATGELAKGVQAALAKFSIGNIFLKVADVRLRISERIVSMRVGGKTYQPFAFETLNVLTDIIGDYGAGAVASLRQLINSMLSVLFHETITMPFPSRVEVNDSNFINKDGGSSITTFRNGRAVNTGIGPNNTQTISSIIIKPNTYFLPPPRCNVIFPNMYTSFTYSHNFLHDITRIVYAPTTDTRVPDANGQTQKVVGQRFAYPPSFQRFVRADIFDADKDSNYSGDHAWAVCSIYGDVYKNYMLKKVNGEPIDIGENQAVDATASNRLRDHMFLTNEEGIRGINMQTIGHIPGAQKFLTGKDNAEQLKIKSSFSKIAEYIFFKERFEHRQFSLTISFNPHLALGFSIAIVDESELDATVVGYLQSVTHQITPNGAMTTITVNYAREINEVFDLSGQRLEPIIPAWFDPDVWGRVDVSKTNAESNEMKQNGENVDEDSRKNGVVHFGNVSAAYEQLIGCKAITSTGAAGMANRSSMEGALRNIILTYQNAKKSGDAAELSWVSSFIRRPLVNMLEYFRFLDAFPVTSNLDTEFQIFSGAANKQRGDFVYDGVEPNSKEAESLFGKQYSHIGYKSLVSKKRAAVRAYVNQLKKNTGLRG